MTCGFYCHFKEDRYARLFGIRCDVATSWFLSWLIGDPGRGRALGVSAVKFTGEVLKNGKQL